MRKKSKLTIVIHVLTEDQVLKNVEVCVKNAVDGIFLICHIENSANFLLRMYNKVRQKYPNLWIGLNYLDLMPVELIQKGYLPNDANALWIDDGGIYEDERGYSKAAEISLTLNGWINSIRPKPKVLLFSGTAFKSQRRKVKDLEYVTQTAEKWADVVTTSGIVTGSSAPVEKIEDMHYYLSHKGVLGLASGVTPENIHQYRGVDWFLVATSVTTTDGTEVILEDRLQALVQNHKKMNI